MAKKINPKTFFKKLTQNAIVEAIFAKHTISGIPYATENMDTKETGSLWFNFYDTQESPVKSDLLVDFSIISSLANEKSLHVLNSLTSINATEKPLSVLAESSMDKAAAFFIEQPEHIDAAISISNFYTKSGWVRFKAHSKKPDSLEYVDEEIAKAFSDSLLRSDNRFVRSSTYALDDMYYTRISSEDAPALEMAYDADTDGYKAKSTRTVREICFVFIPSIAEVLIKASGNREAQYEYAEKYVRTLTGNGIEAKEMQLDLSYFKNNTNTDGNYPIAIGNGIESWRVRSVELLKPESKHILSLKFPNTKEDMYMSPMWMFLKDLGVSTDLVGFVIKKISFEVVVQDNKSTDSKGGLAKVLVNMSMDHKCNLNMLLETHRKIDTILQVIGINMGFQDMQVKEEKEN
jgi:hypothetical protein